MRAGSVPDAKVRLRSKKGLSAILTASAKSARKIPRVKAVFEFCLRELKPSSKYTASSVGCCRRPIALPVRNDRFVPDRLPDLRHRLLCPRCGKFTLRCVRRLRPRRGCAGGDGRSRCGHVRSPRGGCRNEQCDGYKCAIQQSLHGEPPFVMTVSMAGWLDRIARCECDLLHISRRCALTGQPIRRPDDEICRDRRRSWQLHST